MRHDTTDPTPPPYEEPCCRPSREVTSEIIDRHDTYQQRRIAWRRRQRLDQSADPRLKEALLTGISVRVAARALRNVGVDIVPIGFPSGTRPEELNNYAAIVRAFSRTFGPNLFDELQLTDPFPSGELYWATFFFQISPWTSPPLMRLNVDNSNGKTHCIGATGNYQSGIMSIFDCTPEEDIFHEIGHAVMRDGIVKGRAPLYFHYSVGGAVPVGGQLQVVDAKEILNEFFGNKQLDTAADIDGLQHGFASDYATQSQGEDFAETFKYYVYRPSELWARVDRQVTAGSQTLSRKADLIARLYAGMYFNDNGIPAGWPGYGV